MTDLGSEPQGELDGSASVEREPAQPAAPEMPESHPSNPAPAPAPLVINITIPAILPEIRRRLANVSREAALVGLLLLVAVGFNLTQLYPEAALNIPTLNDNVLHLANLQQVIQALSAGRDPTDTWLGIIALGYPLFHYYQHLSYLPPAILYLISGGAISAAAALHWVSYLLLSLFPLSVYWAMRRFGFARLPSAFGALTCSLIATNSLYGFDLNSYVWRGYGLYTQLWGMVLLPPTLAQAYAAMKTGKGYFLAVALLAATLLSHLVLGYIALVSLILLALVLFISHRAEFWRHSGRLALLLGLTGLVTAYFFLPFLTEGAYLNRSVWELQGKYDSYGAQWVLTALVSGELFDFGRFPALTLLAALGLAVCVRRWREAHYRIPVALFGVWLLLYFGRPTWGALLNLLPMSRDLQLHRLIAGVHLGGLFLVGLGLALPWEWAWAKARAEGRASMRARYLLVPVALTGLLLYPVYAERLAYLAQNTAWMREQQTVTAAEANDLAALKDKLQTAPPGRVYAGLAAKWGKDYKVGQVPMYGLLVQNGLDTVGYLYHSLSLNADVQVLFDDAYFEQYDLFNVRYVLTPVDWTVPAYYTTIGDFGRHRLYEIPTSGYFELVDSPLAFSGDKRDFYPAASAWLASDLPRLKQHPVIYLAASAPADSQAAPLSQAAQVMASAQKPDAFELPRGSITSETVERSTSSYQADVNVERESVLMLKVTYHPNWRATVDDVEAQTMMVMPSYIGVKLTPGAHHVRLEYRPSPQRGVLIVLGLLTLALTALAEWRREDVARLVARLNLSRFMSLTERWPRPTLSGGRLAALQQSLVPHLPYLGVVALAVLLAGLPLLQFKLMSGHDTFAYLPRYVEFYEGLKGGQVFPRWAPDLGAGYGEPTFNFNPPVIYYLPAFFHGVGFTFIASENLAVLTLLLLAGLGMYLFVNEFTGQRGGLVSAVAYLFAPYVLVTLYVRHALADFSALAFIPLAFWGLYRYATEGYYRFLVVGVFSIALLLLSSFPVALMTLPALALFLGYVAWAEKNWPGLWRGLWCLALGLGLSAFFVLPALAETSFVHISRREERLDFHDHFLYLYQLIYSPWGYGLSVPGPQDGMSFSIGPVHLLLTGAALWLFERLRAASRRAGLFILFFPGLLLVAVFFSTGGSLFLWERVSLLHPLQFPWRFLSLIAFGTAALCGLPFLILERLQRQRANLLMAATLVGLFIFGFAQARPEAYIPITDADYSPQNIAKEGLAATAREFEPIWVQEFPQTPAQEPLTFVGGQGSVLASRLTPTTREFVVEVTDAARLRLNTFYFPGWTLHVDSVERPMDYANPQGVIEFSLGPGQHGVKFIFGNTPIRLWSTWLSWLTLLGLVAMPWVGRLRRRAAGRLE